MKKNVLFILINIALLSLIANVSAADKRKKYIDPSFKTLLTYYPRKKPIVNPEVPRISAELAFKYYKLRKAIFVAAGEAAIKASLPGAISLKKIKNPDVFKKHKNILIILFCH